MGYLGQSDYEAMLQAELDAVPQPRRCDPAIQQPCDPSFAPQRLYDPPLPSDASDCETYAKWWCDYDRARRGIPGYPCDLEALTVRCVDLVERRAAGEIGDYAARIGAARIDHTVDDQARDISSGIYDQFGGGVAEAIRSTASPEGRAAADAILSARARAGLVKFALIAAASAIALGIGYWWWARRRRGEQ